MAFTWPYIITGLAIAIVVVVVVLIIVLVVIVIIYVVIGPPPEPVGGGGDEIPVGSIFENFCASENLVPYYLISDTILNYRYITTNPNLIGNNFYEYGKNPIFYACSSFDFGTQGVDFDRVYMHSRITKASTPLEAEEFYNFKSSLPGYSTTPMDGFIQISNPSNGCTANTYKKLKGTFEETATFNLFTNEFPFNGTSGFTDNNGFSLFVESNFEGYDPRQGECL